MKKSNKEVLDFFGLKVGDKVIVEGCDYSDYFVIKTEKDGLEYAESAHCSTWGIPNLASILFEHEYEIVTPKKKIGDMNCDEMVCRKCPLRAIDCGARGITLYEALEIYRKNLSDDYGSLKVFEKTFIDAIKAELNKEEEECEK